MFKPTAILCTLLLAANSAFAAGDPDELRRDFVWSAPAQGSPQAIVMGRTYVTAADFFIRYAPLFNLGSADRLVTSPATVGAFLETLRFQQEHDGIPVVGGEARLMVGPRGGVRYFAGRLIEGLPTVSARLTPAQAIHWAEEEAASRWRTSRSRMTQAAPVRTTLVFAPGDAAYTPRNYALAWRVVLEYASPIGSAVVDIDAVGGQVVRWSSGAVEAWDPIVTAAQSSYDGQVSFNAQTDIGLNVCRLTTNWIWSRDAHTGFDLAAASDITAACSFPGEQQFVSPHYGVDKALEYFYTKFGRLGFDGAGSNLPVYIDVLEANVGLGNAFYSTVGRHVGVTSNPGGMIGSLDMMAHEVGHAVTQTSVVGGLGVSGEAGAIGEHIADVFGTLVEFEYASDPDYYIGDDEIGLGGPFRRMDYPAALPFTHPDTYGAGYWNPNLGVHELAGVGNMWFYLLANGGSGTNAANEAYAVTRIGRNLAGRIVYDTITEDKLSSSAGYFAYAVGTLSAAVDRCGMGSQAQISVIDAWTAVKVGGGGQLFDQVPAPGATGVEPWSAKLLFEAPDDETDWVVQVAIDPMFSAPINASLWNTEGANGVTMQRAFVELAPDAEYYWRVRRADITDSSPACWRPMGSFRTAAKVVIPTSPARGASAHPWELKLEWDGLPGPMSYYEAQTFLGQACSGNPIAGGSVNAAWKTVNLKVNQPHAWRVRAVSSSGQTAGPWSTCLPFNTTMPAATIDFPFNNAWVHPWDLTVEWSPVKGVRGYRFMTVAHREGFVPIMAGEIVSEEVPPAPTLREIYLVPQLSYDAFMHWFRVVPLGPEPWLEEGTFDDIYVFNDGDLTIPTVTQPAVTPSEDYPKFFYGQDLTFVWNTVPDAVRYHLEGHPVRVQGSMNAPWVQWSVNSFTFNTTNGVGATQGSLTLPGATVTSPANGSEIYGYWVAVRAEGPDGSLSPIDPIEAPGMAVAHVTLHPGDMMYTLHPPAVQPSDAHFQYYGPGTIFWNGGESDRYVLLGAHQSPVWSPTGQYEYRLSSDGACLDADSIVTGSATKKTYFFGSYGQSGSYRVRARGLYGDFDSAQPNQGWSDCMSFQIVDSNPTQPPPGSIQSQCGQTIIAGGALTETHAVHVGSSAGNVTLDWDLLSIPDVITVKYKGQVVHTSGCAGGQGTVQFPVDGTVDFIEVTVSHQACGNQNTEWSFLVHCPTP